MTPTVDALEMHAEEFVRVAGVDLQPGVSHHSAINTDAAGSPLIAVRRCARGVRAAAQPDRAPITEVVDIEVLVIEPARVRATDIRPGAQLFTLIELLDREVHERVETLSTSVIVCASSTASSPTPVVSV